MTVLKKLTAVVAVVLLGVAGLTAPAYAAPGRSHRPGDHPKLDRKLNDRAAVGDAGTSRVIITLKPGWDATGDIKGVGGRLGRRLGLINGQVVELPNRLLRKLADSPAVESIHWDRPTQAHMSLAAVNVGARAAQLLMGLDGAGVGVAVIDSGVTSWHDDLTYNGSNPAVKTVGGQRVVKFVDFVNGRTTPYDDYGHGTHVAGIIAGNGYDSFGLRAGIAPAADLVSLKVLDGNGGGYISNVIAALDWAVQNKAAYNIRVINLSVGAAVTESYNTDPFTLAAKRAVDAGIVVVAAAGNLGKAPDGRILYGGITAPGNAPWVLTVGAYSTQGTVTRNDDIMASNSSRGPTAVDFGAKPDLVAPGTGIVSMSVAGSTMYNNMPSYLLPGLRATAYKPYLSLTGTSMAAPIVAGTAALMIQANPNLTPNLVKAILEYTAQNRRYNPLTQGAGFLNSYGAVTMARFFRQARAGSVYPSDRSWSRTILWGNHKITGGVIKPAGNAYAQNIVWGTDRADNGDNIVWGTACRSSDCGDNIVWGTSILDGDNIVWGTSLLDGDNIVWGTSRDGGDNIVWGTSVIGGDNIVWGTSCGGFDCDNIVWGTSLGEDLDNIVWGTSVLDGGDNIVWGTSSISGDNIVWGTSADGGDNIVWGTSDTVVDDAPLYLDDNDYSGVDFDSLFSGGDTTATTGTSTTTDATSAAPAPVSTTGVSTTGGSF